GTARRGLVGAAEVSRDASRRYRLIVDLDVVVADAQVGLELFGEVDGVEHVDRRGVGLGVRRGAGLRVARRVRHERIRMEQVDDGRAAVGERVGERVGRLTVGGELEADV